ncbi:YhcH/YjgK/YiaL family protein [bacterium]|nr:YhcH/YjgK/YiaL family protein [bacterium]
MFCSSLLNRSHWSPLLSEEVWHKSLAWLLKNASAAELGTYSLGQPDWFANVHEYKTKDQELCTWESHQHTIDIQYVISGSEQILWMPTSELEGPTKIFDNIDRQEWKVKDHLPQLPTKIVLSAGFFAIFLPNEGHCPMIRDGNSALIRKTVIKIPFSLLRDGQL